MRKCKAPPIEEKASILTLSKVGMSQVKIGPKWVEIQVGNQSKRQNCSPKPSVTERSLLEAEMKRQQKPHWPILVNSSKI